jgi:hypothetical protein
MRRAVMAVILLALVAGGTGNVVQRMTYGPSPQERAYKAQLDAARAAGNQTEYERIAGELAVTVGPREMLWTMGPPVLIIGTFAGAVLLLRRRRA